MHKIPVRRVCSLLLALAQADYLFVTVMANISVYTTKFHLSSFTRTRPRERGHCVDVQSASVVWTSGVLFPHIHPMSCSNTSLISVDYREQCCVAHGFRAQSRRVERLVSLCGAHVRTPRESRGVKGLGRVIGVCSPPPLITIAGLSQFRTMTL